MAYSALTYGAVPEGYEQIVLLDGVEYETTCFDDGNVGYMFKPTIGFEVNELTQSELKTLDDIIQQLGNLSTGEVVDKMHNEKAYKCTGSNCIISYSFAENLTLE